MGERERERNHDRIEIDRDRERERDAVMSLRRKESVREWSVQNADG